MKEPIVRANEVHLFLGLREIVAHVTCHSTYLTRHERDDHFEMINDWIFQFLYQKVHLGGEHVHTVNLVDPAGSRQGSFIILALIGGHLLNKSLGRPNAQRKECSPGCNINVLMGGADQSIIKA